MVTIQKTVPLWKRALVLLALAIFFFASYNYANHYASELANVPTIRFEWERYIPLVPWMIVPYWTIDLIYGLSFLLCRSKEVLVRHALRLFTAQCISVACFVLFPLKFSVTRPSVDSVFGHWFDMLMMFDKPFNQAPSLHIVLLLILWDIFAKNTSGWKRLGVDIWAVLIAISVLTTWQHHFIDLPTGIWVGALCMWLWPLSGQTPFSQFKKPSNKSLRLASYYLIGAVLFTFIACSVGGMAWTLLWLASACFLYVLAYLGWGVNVLQKAYSGKSLAAGVLFFPLECALWVNSRLWTFKQAGPKQITEHVLLGPIPWPWSKQVKRIDLSAELSAAFNSRVNACYPHLDLLPISAQSFVHIAQDIHTSAQTETVLVCCALGYSRSASAVIAYLLLSQQASSVSQAYEMVKSKHPKIVINEEQVEQLNQYARYLNDGCIK